MGKRKKKGFNDDVIDDDISTDDENQDKLTSNQDLTKPNCPHVGKAVHVTSLKKALKAAWLRVGACGTCSREKRNENAKSQGKICLKPTSGHFIFQMLCSS